MKGNNMPTRVTYKGLKNLDAFYKQILQYVKGGSQPVPVVVVAHMALAFMYVLKEDEYEDSLLRSAYYELPEHAKRAMHEACDRFREAV